ncbi:MAG: homoserine dehydrogenase [Firmicutes bacterium HGW-Firmicutes-21]|nr:MAG: homoserine dehydrogenase [Firmicutes bacterium HGW-Firmicutes-21]
MVVKMFNIAILGFGIVGKGVYEVLKENGDRINAALGNNNKDASINIKYILDRLEFKGHPLADRVTQDYAMILADKTVSVVVETMGGASPAFEFSKAALEAKKSVVTSNKEVVDKHGDVLIEIAARNGVSYMYEASVGGGIPIIHPLQNCFLANKIIKIAGILNGTTNFILTKMSEEKMPLEEALSIAKAKGYAEANPHADIAGLDSARKICILAGIAFGRYLPFNRITVIEGISAVTAEDFEAADKLGYTIKLLAVAELVGNRAKLLVAPHLVKKGSLIAAVNDVYNAIVVTGSAVGEVVFYGQGAGSLPTASAVVTDVLEILKSHPKAISRAALEDGFLLPSNAFGDKTATLSNGSVYRLY